MKALSQFELKADVLVNPTEMIALICSTMDENPKILTGKRRKVSSALNQVVNFKITNNLFLALTEPKKYKQLCENYLKALNNLAEKNAKPTNSATIRTKVGELASAKKTLLDLKKVITVQVDSNKTDDVDWDALPYDDGLHAVIYAVCDVIYPEITTLKGRDVKLSELSLGRLNPPHFRRIGYKKVKMFTNKTHGKDALNIFEGWSAIEKALNAPEGTFMQYIPEMAHLPTRVKKQQKVGAKKLQELLPLGERAKQQFALLARYFMTPSTVDELITCSIRSGMATLKLSFDFLQNIQLKEPASFWETNGRGQTPSVNIWENVMRNFSTAFVNIGIISDIEEFEFSQLLTPINIQMFYEYMTDGIYKDFDGKIVTELEQALMSKKEKERLKKIGGGNGKNAMKCLNKLLAVTKGKYEHEVAFLPYFHAGCVIEGQSLSGFRNKMYELNGKIKSLADTLKTNGKAIPRNGKTNVFMFINTDNYRKHNGLEGGVMAGFEEYKQIAVELEKLATKRSTSDSDQVKYLSIALIMRMSISFPLRISNWADIRITDLTNVEDVFKLTKPNGNAIGSLVTHHDGTHEVIIPRGLVKNKKNLQAGVKGLHRGFDTVTNRKITEYLEVRKRLTTDDTNRFLVWDGLHNEDSLRAAFGEQTYRVMQKLWPERTFIKRGINPHALRHVSATVYLETHRKDWLGLSALLDDSLATVMSVYAEADRQALEDDIKSHGEEQGAF